MKLLIAIVGLMACSMAHADLETASQNLSNCVVGYAEGQIHTSKEASKVMNEAFINCTVQLRELHDSIGPEQSQWTSLNEQQKQSITKIRDKATDKIREQMSSQLVKYISEARKDS